MMPAYLALMVCLGLGLECAHVAATNKLPSDRLKYDRKNATGPMMRNAAFKRVDKDQSDDIKPTKPTSAAASVKRPSENHDVQSASGTSQPLDRRYNGVMPKCRVHASYPYEKSPTIDISGVNGLFNSVLVGYQSPHSMTRENKGSMFGWSTVFDGEKGEDVALNFNVNYVPIKVEAQPTSYCALILQPPLYINSATLRTFSSIPRHMKRSLHSTDALSKLLKKKNIKLVTSCCFQVFPNSSVGNATPAESTKNTPVTSL